MSELKAPISHIEFDAEGRPWIAGTPYRVTQVVLDHMVHGWSAEEIHYQHYGVPSIAQIHAALAYYYDNQAAIDEEIKKEEAEIEAIKKRLEGSPLRDRLRARGLL